MALKTTPPLGQSHGRGTGKGRKRSEEVYLLGSQALSRPLFCTKAKVRLNYLPTTLPNQLPSTVYLSDGPCEDLGDRPAGVGDSSDTRRPSSSILTSTTISSQDSAGTDALDISGNSTQPGKSTCNHIDPCENGTHIKNTKNPSNKRTSYAISSTSKSYLEESEGEEVVMFSDVSVNSSDNEDAYHEEDAPDDETFDYGRGDYGGTYRDMSWQADDDDVNHDQTSKGTDLLRPGDCQGYNDRKSRNKQEPDCQDYNGSPTSQNIDQMEPMMNESDYSDDHMVSSDISEYEAAPSCERGERSSSSETSFENEVSSEETPAVYSPGRCNTWTIPKGRGSFKCPECEKVYAYKHNMKRHIKRTHLGHGSQGTTRGNKEELRKGRIRVYKCKECQMSFSKSYHLASHVGHKHKKQNDPNECNVQHDGLPGTSSGSVHQCQKCRQTFSRACALASHLREIHTGNKEFQNGTLPSIKLLFRCKEGRCSKRFFSRRLLDNHLRESHRDPQLNSNKNQQEDQCKEHPHGFSTTRTLAKHVCEHRKDKGRDDNHDLLDEFLSVSLRSNYECKRSYKRFREKGIRNAHEAECNQDNDEEGNDAVEEEDPAASDGRVYQCQICPKSYARKCDLAIHMKRGKHTGRKHKSSAVAERNVPSSAHEFGQNRPGDHESISALEEDVPPASEYRVYQCHECPKSFSRKCDLAMHMKRRKHPGRKHETSTVSEKSVQSSAAMTLHEECSETFNTGNSNERNEESLKKKMCCRFCPMTWLELMHQHEMECVKSPFITLNQSKS